MTPVYNLYDDFLVVDNFLHVSSDALPLYHILKQFWQLVMKIILKIGNIEIVVITDVTMLGVPFKLQSTSGCICFL